MKGKLFVLSGPSGTGKSTVIAKVMKQYPNLQFSVSATTREIRPGEVDGESYHFISHDQFRQMIANDELLEHAQYVDNYYGTPWKPIEAAMEQGIDILLDIEPQGALQVRAKRPEATLLFLAPPSLKELETRLTSRGDTAPELVKKRLEQAKWELTQVEKYDYIVINDEVDNAAREVLAVITAEKCRTKDRIDILKEEL